MFLQLFLMQSNVNDSIYLKKHIRVSKLCVSNILPWIIYSTVILICTIICDILYVVKQPSAFCIQHVVWK